MSEEIKRVQEFLDKVVKDESFAKRVKEDKSNLSDLGWSPEVISGFQVKASNNPKDSDYWGCGTDCGCSSKMGEGNGHACQAGHGS